LLDRFEADVDYEDTAEAWIEAVINKVQESFGTAQPAVSAITHVNGNGQLKEATVTYNRKNPFSATVLENIQLNGRGSAKQTYHLELSLEGSGLQY
ncbi:hypothetical protein MD537_25825, partial [Flavihumibacter sediminis]|nr:hypothetical protein [Flavihumibacter sediminis]